MSTPKFTVGPWHVDPKRHMRVVAGDDVTVASTGTTDSIRNEWEANARLIALSPEMYWKLVALRDAHHCVCKLNQIVASLGAGINCTRCELDALLAKA